MSISMAQIREIIRVETALVLKEKKYKKQPKKTCSSREDGRGHSISHSKKNGQFVSRKNTGEVGSYSVRDSKGKDCAHAGQAKSGKGQSKLFTSIACGREDRKDPNKHSGKRCYDGAKISLEGVLLDAPNTQSNDKRNEMESISFEDKWKQFLESTSSEDMARLKKHICSGLYSMDTLLKLQNRMALSAAGDLNKPAK